MKSRPLQERIFSRLQITDGCWLWLGRKTLRGYGRISSGGRGGKELFSHRVVYELMVGPIPPSLELDHLCRNHSCCCPSHLEPVTHAENVRRGERATKTSCKNGHAFTAENTYIWKKRGWRHCLLCDAARHRKLRALRGGL